MIELYKELENIQKNWKPCIGDKVYFNGNDNYFVAWVRDDIICLCDNKETVKIAKKEECLFIPTLLQLIEIGDIQEISKIYDDKQDKYLWKISYYKGSDLTELRDEDLIRACLLAIKDNKK